MNQRWSLWSSVLNDVASICEESKNDEVAQGKKVSGFKYVL